VVIGEAGVLVRGLSGAGKTGLALRLIEEARASGGFAWLVADDRVLLEEANGRLIARAPRAIAGLIERRGLGIETIDHETEAIVRLVVEVGEEALPRIAVDETTMLEGVEVPLFRVPADAGAVASIVLARLRQETHR
jgi:HPr kinase/phosphorylase